ncbi:MAK10-like protein [Tanacetum coccineum]
MGDKNPIRTLGDDPKPSHEGYRNTIELIEGNNVVPLRSNTIRLVGSISIWVDLTTCFLAQFFPLGRTAKLLQIFYDHVDPATRRTIDQSAGGKLPDRNAEESWALLEDLALYDNESWNDPRDFAKPVKAISLLQDVPSTSDRRLIELENQVQCLMEAHLAPKQHVQLKKSLLYVRSVVVPTTLSTAWKIPSKLLLIMLPRVQTKREVSGLPSNPSKTILVTPIIRHEKDTQTLGEMSNKIDTVTKAITDRIMGELPSDMVKNPKLNIKSTASVLSARSCPMEDSQCSNQIHKNERALKDEFQDLHLNLPILEVQAHALIYNAILDKYVESLELSKNGSAFVQGEMPIKMEDPRLFTLPCRLEDSKSFNPLADLGSCVNIIPLYLFKKLKIGLLEETHQTKSYPVRIVRDVEVHIGRLKLLNDFYVIDMKKDLETPLLVGRGFLTTAKAVVDYRKDKVAVGEGITRESYKTRPSSDGVGAQTPYYARKELMDCHLPGEWETARTAEINPFKDVLVFRRMVEFLGAIPINLKRNMWELEDSIENPIN